MQLSSGVPRLPFRRSGFIGARMLSQRTRYTIRALLHLADRYGEGPVQLSEIAQAQNLPAKFLTVILSQMRRAGLVETMRGREGGYWLARPPAEISYGEIVRLTRGSLGLLPCASRLAYEQCKNCITEEKCRLHRAMLMVRDETARIVSTRPARRICDRMTVRNLGGRFCASAISASWTGPSP